MNKNRVSGRKKYIWFEYRVRLQILKKLLLGECLNYFFEGSERTIDTHMANLRSKIGQQWISTVRGFGYSFSGIKADSKK